MNEISVSINKKSLNKILQYAQAAYDEHKAEIGGMAICVKGEDNEWRIQDPVILKQEITGSNCSLDKEELAKYYVNTHANNKKKKNDWRFLWWHSHHMMSAFWSGTDINAIDEFSEGDLSFALVVNLKGEYLARASAWSLGMHMDMKLEVIDTVQPFTKKILSEVNELCKTRTYTTVGYKNQLSLGAPYIPGHTEENGLLQGEEEEKFTNKWTETAEGIEEEFSKCAKGEISIQELKKALALMNGNLSREKIGIRINYEDITTLNDILTTQSYDIIEVDEKYQAWAVQLEAEAEDFYSYNWSYGIGRRYGN